MDFWARKLYSTTEKNIKAQYVLVIFFDKIGFRIIGATDRSHLIGCPYGIVWPNAYNPRPHSPAAIRFSAIIARRDPTFIIGLDTLPNEFQGWGARIDRSTNRKIQKRPYFFWWRFHSFSRRVMEIKDHSILSNRTNTKLDITRQSRWVSHNTQSLQV